MTERLTNEQLIEEGKRLLEHLGRTSLVGTTIPHPSQPGRSIKVEEFPLIYDEGRYEEHVRPFLVALEDMAPEDPDRIHLARILNEVLDKRLNLIERG